MSYTVEQYPRLRRMLSDAWAVTKQKNTFHGLLEIDITKARSAMRQYKEKHSDTLSFTAYISYCVAKALINHKHVCAFRNWSGNVVIFNEVDINVLIERKVEGHLMGIVHLIREANSKSLMDIHRDIRKAQAAAPEEVSGVKDKVTWMNLMLALPPFLRRFIWRILLTNPHFIKKIMGTVSVSAVGMAGKGGGWGIPNMFLTFSIIIGGISEKPYLENDKICMHEYLHLTLAFDHEVIDGAPAARFTAELRNLIESGKAIEEIL